MQNSFLTLDVPQTDGSGAALITRMTGTPKTFVCSGAPSGGRYIVEGSNDAGATWDVLTGSDGTQVFFTAGGAGAKSVDCVVDRVRVRSIGNRAANERPTISMGAPPAQGTNVFGVLDVPTSFNGVGAPFDLGLEAGPLKTFSLRGAVPPGSRYTVLASNDGQKFDEVMLFSADQQGVRPVEALCRYLRVHRAAAGSAPVIAVGSEGLLGGGRVGQGPTSVDLTVAEWAAHGTTRGEEEVLFSFRVPLAGMGVAQIVPELSGTWGYDGAAGAQFRVRMGGTPLIADGVEIVRLDIMPPVAPTSAVGPAFSPPAEPATLIKVTAEGANAAASGVVVNFRSQRQ